MDVVQILFVILMGILGAALGSFACCQAWRIKAVSSKKKLGKWSCCMECGKKLMWFDNIPIVSWLMLRGKCRYCHKKIGMAEFWSEVLMAVVFVLVALFYMPISENGYNYELLIQMVIFCIAMVPMMILAVYDAKWGELPVFMLVIANVFGVIFFVVREVFKYTGPCACAEKVHGGFGFTVGKTQCMSLFNTSNVFDLVMGDLLSLLMAVAILAGLYYLIYEFSHERFVGGGDWILCLAIALVLGSWELALIELFLSNFVATAVMLPAQKGKRKKRQFSFGPFLVAAFVVVFLLQNFIKQYFAFV